MASKFTIKPPYKIISDEGQTIFIGNDLVAVLTHFAAALDELRLLRSDETAERVFEAHSMTEVQQILCNIKSN